MMKFHQAARLGLVVMLAAALGGCWYDDSATVDKKIAEAVAKVQPQTQTQAPPAAPAPGSAKATVNCGPFAATASAGGANSTVDIKIDGCNKPCENDCAPKAAPPCQQDCERRPAVQPPAPQFYRKEGRQEYPKGPLVQPAPPVYRPAPQRVSSCFVDVHVFGPQTPVEIKDGSGRVVGRANIVGKGEVAVPCSFARERRGQICLVTGKPNAPARNLGDRWFRVAQQNLASGQRVLNFGTPDGFRKN